MWLNWLYNAMYAFALMDLPQQVGVGVREGMGPPLAGGMFAVGLLTAHGVLPYGCMHI